MLTKWIGADYNESSDSESETESGKKKKSKAKSAEGDEPVDYSKYNDIQGGGLIKTRSQRQQEAAKEKEFELSNNNSSIDVDSVWASMKGGNTEKPKDTEKPKVSTSIVISDSTSSIPADSLKDEYITIKRVYNFAGKMTTEEKRVLASSAEGKAFIAEQAKEQPRPPSLDGKKRSIVPPTQKRVVKRRKSSMMDELAAGKPKKLNTLEKSRLDWLGYVDEAGLKDDLSQHNKDGYLKKQDFLMRVEQRIDDDWKQSKRK